MKDVVRDFSTDWKGIAVQQEPKTVGMTADKNSDKYSEDYKAKLMYEDTKYRREGYDEAYLPPGAKFYGPHGERESQQGQRKKDPKRKKS
jgi:hypothetical protein